MHLTVDELYLNHVAVPGIINSFYNPKSKMSESRSPTRLKQASDTLGTFPVSQKVLNKRI